MRIASTAASGTGRGPLSSSVWSAEHVRPPAAAADSDERPARGVAHVQARRRAGDLDAVPGPGVNRAESRARGRAGRRACVAHEARHLRAAAGQPGDQLVAGVPGVRRGDGAGERKAAQMRDGLGLPSHRHRESHLRRAKLGAGRLVRAQADRDGGESGDAEHAERHGRRALAETRTRDPRRDRARCRRRPATSPVADPLRGASARADRRRPALAPEAVTTAPPRRILRKAEAAASTRDRPAAPAAATATRAAAAEARAPSTRFARPRP